METTSEIKPDVCEKIVTLFEYISSYSFQINDLYDHLNCCIEKGSLYRGMVSLCEFDLIEKLLYLCEKFSEYNNRFISYILNITLSCFYSIYYVQYYRLTDC